MTTRQPGRVPNEAQQRFNGKIAGQNKNGLSRARQIVRDRSFVYDGSLAPSCLTCGNPRENRRRSKCDRCEAAT